MQDCMIVYFQLVFHVSGNECSTDHKIVLFLLELSKWVGIYESTRLTTSSDRVELKFFYKFQYGLIFDPTHPYWTCGEPGWWANS